MIHERISLAPTTRAFRTLLQSARALGYGFVLLAWMFIAPLVLVVMWLRRIRDHTDQRASRPGRSTMPSQPSGCDATKTHG